MDDSDDLPPADRREQATPGPWRGHTALQPRHLLHIQVDRHPDPDRGVISLLGELDMSSGPALHEAIIHLEEAGVSALTIDLSGLDFIDSSGLRILLEAHRRALSANHPLRLIPGPPAVQTVFQVTGVDGILSFS